MKRSRRVYYARLEGRPDLLVLERDPVDSIEEEGMSLDGLLATTGRTAAQSLVGILGHEALEDGDGVLAQPDRIEHLVVQDGLEEVVLVVGLERRLTGHHLVHEHAQRPPVHAEAVVELLQDLGRDVVGRAAEGGRQLALSHALLAHAEVG